MGLRRKVVFGMVTASFLALVGCGKKEQAGDTKSPPEVEFAQPIEREVFEYETLPGRVEAIDSVEIRARVTGNLDKMEFIEGSEVKAGDLLFQIDPREYEAKLEAAKAGHARAHASHEQAKADANRASRLKTTNAISQEELESKQLQLLEAQANLRSAQAALDSAQLDLEYTRILSPIDGKISSTKVTNGNLISIGDTLTSIVRQTPVYVSFELPERSVLRWDTLIRDSGEKRLSQNVTAEVGLLSEEGFPREAEVNFVDNAINPGTATLRLRAVLANEDRSARVGLYTRVRLSFKKPVKTLLIPERAVSTDQNQRFVFTVGEDNVVSYRKIIPGQMHEGMMSIQEGLTADDRVVTEGILSLRAGMKVNPKPAPRP